MSTKSLILLAITSNKQRQKTQINSYIGFRGRTEMISVYKNSNISHIQTWSTAGDTSQDNRISAISTQSTYI